jgi:membrane protease YdiL (CAAX protease family)
MTAPVELDLSGSNGSGRVEPLPAAQPKAVSSKAFAAYLILYLVVLALAELVATVVNPRSGLVIDGVLLVLILLQSSRQAARSEQKFLLTLALAPLTRLISLSMPLLVFPYIFWYLVVGVPLFLSVFLVYRLTGYKPAEVGLSLGSGLPLQLAVGLTGLVFGYVEYRLLPPQTFTASFSQQNILLLALILLVFTGLLEELIFRGLMQRAALEAIRKLGILYVSLVFAVLHIGYQSALNLAFVFLVGLFFSLVVARTRSILGVALAHGLTNIMLYLVFPVLLV